MIVTGSEKILQAIEFFRNEILLAYLPICLFACQPVSLSACQKYLNVEVIHISESEFRIENHYK